MSCYETLSVIAYFLTFAATAVYAVFAWGQWRNIAHQVNIMRQHHRPWIMVTPDNSNGWPTQDMQSFPFHFKWIAENVGESPAFITKVYFTTEVIALPVPNQEPSYPEPEPIAEFILPPNRTHQSISGRALTPSEITSVINGQKCLMFYGFIEYNDTTRRPHHRTCFCSYWRRKGEAWEFSPVGPPSYVKYTESNNECHKNYR